MRSMTGFGSNLYEVGEHIYEIEIKTVNHKYTDISIRMPKIFNFLETEIRCFIAEKIHRGKIDISINFRNTGKSGRVISFNEELASTYIEGLKSIANKTNISANLEVIDISKMPDILEISYDYDEEILKLELFEALKIATEQLIVMKEKEGEKLKNDIKNRFDEISEKIAYISQISTGLVEKNVVKLKERIEELLGTLPVDENRLAQEIVIYSDKTSIEEEVTRLKSHIEQGKCFLLKPSPIGKKLDFLIQEMNRETNTIGSKANCLEITKEVVEIKTQIENIREQIQNIE